jgi:aerobic C4-dicarboxylate transport protein
LTLLPEAHYHAGRRNSEARWEAAPRPSSINPIVETPERFMPSANSRQPLYAHLYFQVLVGVALGILAGYLWPHSGVTLRPLGDGFIKLIKMIIAPVIFCTVVVGIAKMGDMRAVGRIGVKALIYFEVLSTVALLIGLVIINVLQPGFGINADPATLDTAAISSYTSSARQLTTAGFLMNIIPTTVVNALVTGEILQVLLFSVLFGLALLHLGEKGRPVVHLIDHLGEALFRMVGIITRAAPIGAFGAMAFTIGQYGVGTLLSLGKLMAGFYATCVLFILVVLGAVAWWAGFSLLRFLRYIKGEILIVLGTSSSETVLPLMMARLEHMGCPRSVVGLVIPTGYSFNLDGTSIYMTMAAIFIAQATNTHLTLAQQLGILAVLLLTSKGASAVTGAGFVTLAATLSAIPTIPVAGLALIIGIDRFMSEARAITNLIGNGVGTVAVARWEGSLDTVRMQRVLGGETVDAITEPQSA